LTRTLKQLYEDYKYCVVHIAVRNASTGGVANGSGFHIGDGLIVTARHVIEGRAIESVRGGYHKDLAVKRILFPSDEKVDLAILETDFSLAYYMSSVSYVGDQRRNSAKTDHIPLGFHLDDWVGDEFVLSKVLLLGYPSIPLSREPTLVAAVGEVNAVVDKYNGPHPHFIISPSPRGGFSGGPVISEYGFLLGVLTESLTENNKDVEVGFAAAISIEPLLVVLAENHIRPKSIDEETWSEFFASDSGEDVPRVNGGPTE
jgi:S1-C subfamily serine protease